jgi:GDP-mannose 4,6 dehydratase
MTSTEPPDFTIVTLSFNQAGFLRQQEALYLRNLDAARDWGYVKEYVEGMWRMLQAEEPSDYVPAGGCGATIRDFCEVAFARAGYEAHVLAGAGELLAGFPAIALKLSFVPLYEGQLLADGLFVRPGAARPGAAAPVADTAPHGTRR